MRAHELKTWPVHFAEQSSGAKNFELRRDDRYFYENDVLILREWDPDTERYTGRELRRRVTIVIRAETGGVPGLRRGYSILGTAPLRRDRFKPASPDWMHQLAQR